MHTARCISRVAVCLMVLLVASTATAQTSLTPKEQLGKLLFFDRNLSSPAGQSCACCHDPGAGFADPNCNSPVSTGVLPDRCGNRNAPTISYCANTPDFHYDATLGEYIGGQGWDGRNTGLLDRAQMPFLNPLEMNNPDPWHVVEKVRTAPYSGMFGAVYGLDPFADTDLAFGMIADAIAAYERSREISPFTSKFDQHLASGVALSPTEAAGLAIFEGKGRCTGCHPSAAGPGGALPLFTDHTYENVGVPRNPDNPFYDLPAEFNPRGESWVDLGLGLVLGDAELVGRMMVPTLRNVALTAPYGHNGYFATLREMVAFAANRVSTPLSRKDPGRPHQEMTDVVAWPAPEVNYRVNVTEFGVAGLTDHEIDAVVAFLGTLSDGYVQMGRKDPGRPRMETVESGTPAALGLSPNPFNPSTRIEFTVSAPATVRVRVYDVSGRLVRSLVDEAVPAGVHAATWDGRDAHGATVASGVYFIRLDTGSETRVKKAVLAR